MFFVYKSEMKVEDILKMLFEELSVIHFTIKNKKLKNLWVCLAAPFFFFFLNEKRGGIKQNLEKICNFTIHFV